MNGAEARLLWLESQVYRLPGLVSGLETRARNAEDVQRALWMWGSMPPTTCGSTMTISGTLKGCIGGQAGTVTIAGATSGNVYFSGSVGGTGAYTATFSLLLVDGSITITGTPTDTTNYQAATLSVSVSCATTTLTGKDVGPKPVSSKSCSIYCSLPSDTITVTDTTFGTHTMPVVSPGLWDSGVQTVGGTTVRYRYSGSNNTTINVTSGGSGWTYSFPTVFSACGPLVLFVNTTTVPPGTPQWWAGPNTITYTGS